MIRSIRLLPPVALLLAAGACSNKDSNPPTPPAVDTTGPVAVADLTVADTGPTWATLQFTAPSDNEGSVTEYDLRYVEGATFANDAFAGATMAATGAPASPGQTETIRVEDLSAEIAYSFRIRSQDDSGNWSDLSPPTGGATKPLRPPDPGLSFPFSCPGALPIENTLAGTLPPDQIPMLLDPDFLDADEADYVPPQDRVFGMEVNGKFFAFPRNLMNYHEIVSFSVGDVRTHATWCPLTFTFIEWRRTFRNPTVRRLASFGVSGALLDNNLVLYDRESLSVDGVATIWPQVLGIGMSGPRTGECLNMGRNVVDTTWELWRKLHPDTKVVTNQNRKTGVKPEFYFINLYEGYWEGTHPIPGRITFPDSRLDPRDVVFGVHGPNGSAAVLLRDKPFAKATIGGTEVVFFRDPPTQTTFAFENRVDGNRGFWATAEPGPDGLPRFLERGTGTLFTLDGVGVEGPLAGSRLPQMYSLHIFWFAWATFFRDTPLLTP